MQILNQLEQKYSPDPSFEAYRLNVQTNGYEATLSQARLYFGTEAVEQDINTTLKNQFYQTSEPVSSPLVENAVKQEMVLSLQENMKMSQEQSQAIQETPQQPHIQSEVMDDSLDGGLNE